MYVIWYRQIWMPNTGWRSYSGSGSAGRRATTNHVHLSRALTSGRAASAAEYRRRRSAARGPGQPALVFLASGAVLVLEIVALRLVGPYVGVTLQVSSSVIGIALAAIAYGAWLGGGSPTGSTRARCWRRR